MIEEIRQPAKRSGEDFWPARDGTSPDSNKLMEQQPPRLIVLVARGTSDNAAALRAATSSRSRPGSRSRWPLRPIATLYEAPVNYRDALVIAISQSGESTGHQLGPRTGAPRPGAVTVGITNEPASKMDRDRRARLPWCARGREKKRSPPPRPTPARC
jgi:glucosamine--fructose-6-phosphate aminotransferase (isomerizing)